MFLAELQETGALHANEEPLSCFFFAFFLKDQVLRNTASSLTVLLTAGTCFTLVIAGAAIFILGDVSVHSVCLWMLDVFLTCWI